MYSYSLDVSQTIQGTPHFEKLKIEGGARNSKFEIVTALIVLN